MLKVSNAELADTVIEDRVPGLGLLGAGTELFAKFVEDTEWRPYTLLSLYERKESAFRVLTWSEEGGVFKSADANFASVSFVDRMVKLKVSGRSYFCTEDQGWFWLKDKTTPVLTKASFVKSGIPLCFHPNVNLYKPERMAGEKTLATQSASSVKHQDVSKVWAGSITVHASTNFLLTSGILAGSELKDPL